MVWADSTLSKDISMTNSRKTGRNAKKHRASPVRFDATPGTPVINLASEGCAPDTTSDFRALRSLYPHFPLRQFRTLPVLGGRFLSDEVHARLNWDSPRACCLSSPQDDDFQGLAILLQVGADMVCWFADPTNRRLWRNLHAWDSGAFAMLAPSRARDGESRLFPMGFGLAPEVLALESELKGRADVSRAFCQKAPGVVTSGELARSLSSLLPEYPQLRSVSCSIVVD